MSNETLNKTKHTPGIEVTEDGRIYSIDSNWRGYGKRELTQDLNTYGYPSVRIYLNGQRKRMCVHVLVAAMFLPARPSYAHQIRHLDGNKLNNHYSNLKWGTAKENADDREIHGKTSRGIEHSKMIKAGIYANK